MSTHRHLQSQLLRLKPGQERKAPPEGLLFLFFVAGTGEYFGDSSAQPAVQPLARGDVLVLPAGSGGRVRAAVASELAFRAFSVCLEHLMPLFTAAQFSLVQTLLDRFLPARFYPAANSATMGWHQLIHELPSEFNLEHRSQLLHVAGAILSEEFRQLRPPLSPDERAGTRMSRLFEQLSVEQILSLSVQALADRFGCSQRHLNRLFKEHFGLPIGALRMEMRLLKVTSLLRHTDFRLNQVAEQCGFHHLGLFNACFKRRFGLSPGQWRKKLDANGDPAGELVSPGLSCRLREVGLCPLPDLSGVSKSIVRGP